MSNKIRIGTRNSRLALAQTNLVVEALKKAAPSLSIEVVSMSTKGDKLLDRSLLSFGGKGVFVEEFESKMLNGEIDIAVHSAKDMPMQMEDGLGILSVLEREDPRDVLVTKKGFVWNREENIIVGTSSLRRQMQIKNVGKTECRLLRGNINTRLQKLEDGIYDGIILAAAGLKRLGLDQEKKYDYHYFSCKEFVPSGGQGIIAIEGRMDSKFAPLLKKICDRKSEIQLRAEREVLRNLDAGCHEPIGVYSTIEEDEMELVLIVETDRYSLKGNACDYLKLARKIAELSKGKGNEGNG